MGKYDGLGAFLARWGVRNDGDGVELGFAQIEGIIRGILPNAAAETQWWTADAGEPPAQHQLAWIEAGFDAIPAPRENRVYFRRRPAPCRRVRSGTKRQAHERPTG